ncbi:MAG: hypothetical protein AABZ44_04665, partial [Elusimicrobiota bacterium]
MSWQSLRQGRSYERSLKTSGWGFSSGLSLPRLPSVNIARRYGEITDSSLANSLDNKTTVKSESLYYSLGAAQARYERDTHIVENRMSADPRRLDQTRRATLEANYFDLKRLKLQTLMVRLDFLEASADTVVSQRQIGSTANFWSMPFEVRSWTNNLGYNNNTDRNRLTQTGSMAQSATLQSRKPIRLGSLNNVLLLNRSDSELTSNGFNEGLSAALTLASGTVAMNFGGNTGLTATDGGARYLSNTGQARLALHPWPMLQAFTEAQLNNTAAKGTAHGGSRTRRLSLGATRMLPRRIETTARFDLISFLDKTSQGRSDS